MLKTKFAELVGESTWEMAQEKYPEFAVEEKLKTKFLNGNNLQLLEDYCKKALRYYNNSNIIIFL